MSPQIPSKHKSQGLNIGINLERLDSDNSSSASKPMLNYNQASLCQRLSNLESYRFLESLDEYKNLVSGVVEEFTIADLGCSHGYNTVTLLKHIIKDMCALNSKLNFRIHLNDLPSNDFSKVFQCLNDQEISYRFLPHFENTSDNMDPKQVLTFVNGDSFYKKLFPTQSQHLITSLFTLHWLPSAPPLLHTINPNSVDVSENEKALYSEIAENSLNTFLKFRAQELKKGGILLFNVIEAPSFTDPIDSAFKKVVQTQHLDITRFKDLVLPTYWRSKDQIFKSLDLFKHQFKLLKIEELTPHGNFTFETVKALLTSTFFQSLKSCKVFNTQDELLSFWDGFIKVLKSECPEDNLDKGSKVVFLQKI